MIDATDKIGTISYNGVPMEVDKNLATKTITQNGTYAASSDSVDGYSEVTVNVPATQPNLGTKTITTNGTYAASGDSLDGFSEVTVNVSAPTPTMYSVTYNLSNYTSSNNVSQVASGSTYGTKLTKQIEDNWDFGWSVTMGGVTLNSQTMWTLEDEYGEALFIIPEVTGNVVITAYANVEDMGEE